MNQDLSIISLNAWEGRLKDALLKFIKSKQDIDIFCFQELYHNALKTLFPEDDKVDPYIFSKLETILPNHNAFFVPIIGRTYGIAIFISKRIKIISKGDFIIHRDSDISNEYAISIRKLQWLKCELNKKIFYILNLHGLWDKKNGKLDTENRLRQSERINIFIESLLHPSILCGDFNLALYTKSIEIIEKNMINLIKMYNITSTRTNLYVKKDKMADYVFIDPIIKVKNFEILNDEVSDHSPLFLKANLP